MKREKEEYLKKDCFMVCVDKCIQSYSTVHIVFALAITVLVLVEALYLVYCKPVLILP